MGARYPREKGNNITRPAKKRIAEKIPKKGFAVLFFKNSVVVPVTIPLIERKIPKNIRASTTKNIDIIKIEIVIMVVLEWQPLF